MKCPGFRKSLGPGRLVCFISEDLNCQPGGFFLKNMVDNCYSHIETMR